MKYSKKTTDAQRRYNLPPETVFYSCLVAAGFTKEESYFAIFKPSDGDITTKIKQLQKAQPSHMELIKALEAERITPDKLKQLQKLEKQKEKEKQRETETGRDEDINKFSEKSYIIEQMAREAKILTGREKVDVLNKIADLQRMKQEENKEEEEKVFYYLPLSCYNCELFKKSQEEKAHQ